MNMTITPLSDGSGSFTATGAEDNPKLRVYIILKNYGDNFHTEINQQLQYTYLNRKTKSLVLREQAFLKDQQHETHPC